MSDSRNKGIICVLTSTLLWASAPVFIHYFAREFDPFTQTFFRYLSAMSFLWIISALFYRDELKQALKKPQRFIIPAVVLVILQTCWTTGLKDIHPAVGFLISRGRIILCAILAYVFFHDERTQIRDPKFIIGTLLTFSAMCALVMGGEIGRRTYIIGIAFMVACAFFGAMYTMSVKRYFQGLHPVVSFTMLCTIATVVFLVLMIAFGRPADLLKASTKTKMLLIVSGIFCLGLAHSAFYAAINNLGVAVTMSLSAISPLFSAVIAYFIFGYHLNQQQMIAGIFIIAGSFIVIRSTSPPPIARGAS